MAVFIVEISSGKYMPGNLSCDAGAAAHVVARIGCNEQNGLGAYGHIGWGHRVFSRALCVGRQNDDAKITD